MWKYFQASEITWSTGKIEGLSDVKKEEEKTNQPKPKTFELSSQFALLVCPALLPSSGGYPRNGSVK